MKIRVNKEKVSSFVKKTTFGLCTTAVVGIPVSAIAYNTYLNIKLEEISFSDENVDKILDFYEDAHEKPVIFVMNDSQGVNLNIGFWKNSYPEYLEEELGATLIDGSSLRYNKTSHIDMLLNHNVTVAELKAFNNMGAYMAIQKVARDIHIPTSLLQNGIGTLGSLIFGQAIRSDDKEIRISELLETTDCPIFIYSSGANDLMFLAKANPATLKKYDSNGDITPKYLYAKEQLENEETMNQLMLGIENNLNNILSINPNTQIVALSIYVPHSLQGEEYAVFSGAIKQYNKRLKELCDKYHAVYIDEEELGTVYNQDDFNFHIDVVGHKALASILIDNISNSLGNQYSSSESVISCDNEGLYGVYCDLMQEVTDAESKYPEDDTNAYLNRIYLERVHEKQEEAEACWQLIKKKK